MAFRVIWQLLLAEVFFAASDSDDGAGEGGCGLEDAADCSIAEDVPDAEFVGVIDPFVDDGVVRVLGLLATSSTPFEIFGGDFEVREEGFKLEK